MEKSGFAKSSAISGAALAFGAPLGLLAARWLAAGRPAPRWAAAELRKQAVTYGYVTSATMAVFTLFGLVLGRRRDCLLAVEREAGRLREEFASIVAHDLRGPIQALRMQAELLLER